VGPRDVDFGRLTACQADAAAGLYAGAMAAYVSWLAPAFEERVREFKAGAARLRDELAGEGRHRRTPTMIGELIAGFNLFLRFAVEVGAITEAEAASLGGRCRRALLEAADAQDVHLQESDPCERYFRLLRAALASGRAFVAGIGGGRPDGSPRPWGWRAVEDGDPRPPGPCAGDGWWRPQGRLVGWLDGPNLYLEAEAAYAAANDLAGEQGESLATSRAVMHKRLHEAGRLVTVDARRRRLTVRKTIGDARQEVLHVRAAEVSSVTDSVPNVPDVPSGEKPPGNGTFSWDVFSAADEMRPTGTSQFPAGNPANGPIGTFGTHAGANESPRGAAADQGPVAAEWEELEI
jgi:hypothetical protein